MDGRQGQMTRSLRRQLSQYLAISILLTACIAGAFSFYFALGEAHELQDDVLRQTASLLQQQSVHERTQLMRTAAESEELAHVIVEPMGLQDGLGVPASLPDGLYGQVLKGTDYRILLSTQADGQRIVVAQSTAGRDAIARDSALRTLAPFLLLIPILILLVSSLVRKAMGPISDLAQQIDDRPEDSLEPLPPANLPEEISPFVAAINRLMARTAQTLADQRRFIADAAHEMRTPLTALSLQAERLAQADMSAVAQERLGTLRQGIARNRQLLDQMLSLARQQVVVMPEKASAATSIRDVCLTVLEGQMALADARQIDLGLIDEQDALVDVPAQELMTIISNLTDNAIRYTPVGGQVDIAIGTQGNDVVVQVSDNGPGIHPEERQRVFDPFYRVLGSGETGSGLGLAIVMTAAKRIKADIELDYADTVNRQGLRVTLRLKLRA